jgi:predicted dehydrogenase
MKNKVGIGIIGAGGICRSRHLPGLAKVDEAEVVAICNRSQESGEKIAREFGLEADIMTDPQALIARSDVDAVMVGTWPYMHCPFALEALEAGKHIFVQARMSMNLAEAKAMYSAAMDSDRVAQICPAPHCMKGDRLMRKLVADGYLGEVRHIYVRSLAGSLADPSLPLHWRQIDRYSGLNSLHVGMLMEWVHRWFGYAETVAAQASTFIGQRPNGTGGVGDVERPDSVHILAEMQNGASAVFLLSGVAQMATGDCIEAYGSEGTLIYELGSQRVLGGRRGDDKVVELAVPADEVREWEVERDFVDAILGRTSEPESTFYEGVKYMEFTEAVFRSAERGATVHLPLVE